MSAMTIPLTPPVIACFEKVGITDRAKQAKLLSDKISFENKACFTKCLFQHENVIDANGNMNVDEVKKIAIEYYQTTLTDKKIADCEAEARRASKDHCQISIKTFECFSWN